VKYVEHCVATHLENWEKSNFEGEQKSHEMALSPENLEKSGILMLQCGHPGKERHSLLLN